MDISGTLSTARNSLLTNARPSVDADDMPVVKTQDPWLQDLIEDHEGVLPTAAALTCLSRNELRWRISSGRWQHPFKGAIITHSGPLTEGQVQRLVLLRWGPKAALAGLTAARMRYFKWADDKDPHGSPPIYLLTPRGHKQREAPLRLNVIVHQSRQLGDEDVFPNLEPRRTRMPRSLIDAASWMPTDRGAMAVLAAGVQQRLTRIGDLREVLSRLTTAPRRELMYQILADIEGGAQALSELDFTRKVIKPFHLPEPSRQAGRRDASGRQRWVDVMWDERKLIVEIDGAQHAEPLQQWDDMARDNDFQLDGYRVLRFPAWLVRKDPALVAAQIRAALRT